MDETRFPIENECEKCAGLESSNDHGDEANWVTFRGLANLPLKVELVLCTSYILGERTRQHSIRLRVQKSSLIPIQLGA